MIQLLAAARGVQAELHERGWPFCFIGGLALQHWGEPRATRDLDLSIFTGFGGEAPIVDALLSQYQSRFPHAREFALEHRVLLLMTPDGVPVDVALAALPFEAAMIDRAREVDFAPDVRLRICSAEDLFVMKAFADREQDRADLAGIARRQHGRLDWEAVVTRLAPLVAAKDDPAILDRVEDLRRQG